MGGGKGGGKGKGSSYDDYYYHHPTHAPKWPSKTPRPTHPPKQHPLPDPPRFKGKDNMSMKSMGSKYKKPDDGKKGDNGKQPTYYPHKTRPPNYVTTRAPAATPTPPSSTGSPVMSPPTPTTRAPTMTPPTNPPPSPATPTTAPGVDPSTSAPSTYSSIAHLPRMFPLNRPCPNTFLLPLQQHQRRLLVDLP